ncbi:MAG: hypothetical protein AAGE43_10025 [Pseudomonadota bacterium]
MSHAKRAWPLVAAVLCSPGLLGAAYEPDYLDAEDPNLIDLEESFDFEGSEAGRFTFDGDLRGGIFASEVDQRDGSRTTNEELTMRFRFGVNYGFSDSFRIRARAAMLCGTEGCTPNPTLESRPARGTNIDPGDITLDELYVDVFQAERIDLLLGRMQTNANTRGGVFISSLSRMTSPNVSVNWTDGAALKLRTASGWDSRIIVQYNDEDGSSTLARPPLDFSDDGSRVSYFYSLDNRERWGPFTQRAFDVTYLPKALLVDGASSGALDDYWALVGRLATEWALGDRGASLIFSGELGYAPNTQTEASAGLSGEGDVGGVAWHGEISWMNVFPGHSVGINYGRADPGWLISPVYRANDETAVLRYHWRPVPGAQLEIQGRWRQDLERLTGLARRKTFDWRVRLTWVLR